MDRERFARVSRRERHVLTRKELLALGASSATISRRTVSEEWSRYLPEVYIVSSSAPSFEQKLRGVMKWADGRPAAFCGETAAYLHRLRTSPPDVVELLVPFESSLRSVPRRVLVYRTRRGINSHGDPRRIPLHETVADLIARSTTHAQALDLLIKGVQQRMNVERFTLYVHARKHFAHRAYVTQMIELTDLGVESHLELAYLRDVERGHLLPQSIGQKRELIRGRWIRSDRWIGEFGTRIELDGELAHPGRMTEADVMRDNDVRLTLDEITLRYRWPQVSTTPCLVAAQVARATQMRGWSGYPEPCSRGCRVLAHLSHLTGDNATLLPR